VILDPVILADLAVAITPKAYVRVTPMTHPATPLGAGFGVHAVRQPGQSLQSHLHRTGSDDSGRRNPHSRPASRHGAPQTLDVEAALWGATDVNAGAPLTLIDL
jgi:hypothetical protein